MMTDQCLQSFLSRRQLPRSGCKVENFAAPHQYFTLRVEHKHFINNYFYPVTRLITSVYRCFKYKWSCFLYMVLVVEEFALYDMEYFRYRFVFSNSLIQTVNSKNAKNIRFNQQILKLATQQNSSRLSLTKHPDVEEPVQSSAGVLLVVKTRFVIFMFCCRNQFPAGKCTDRRVAGCLQQRWFLQAVWIPQSWSHAQEQHVQVRCFL